MDVTASHATCPARVLVVADWAVDPHGVVAACSGRAAEGEVTFALVVPAWLHGLDWVGDPYASKPCAARQLEALTRIATAAGLAIQAAEVGDPDPTSAIEDARAAYPATEILLCGRPRRLSHPFGLARRLRRASGLTIREATVRTAPPADERRGWRVLRGSGHCSSDALQPA